MKASAELIRDFEALDTTTEEKIQWLSNVCREYEQQMPNDRTGQSRLYCLLGEACLQDSGREQGESCLQNSGREQGETCLQNSGRDQEEACLQNSGREQAETAFLKAKEILEYKAHVRKKVGCGFQEIEKDLTDSPEYERVLRLIEQL